MLRLLHRPVALVLTILLLAFSIVSAPVAAAQEPEPDPVADGSRYIGSCLQNASSVSALFVLDRSDSLRNSDPSGIRYQGLETALQQLSQLTRADGKPLSVEVAIAGFDHQYDSARSIVGWRSLNDDPKTVDRTVAQIVKRTEESTAPRGGTDFEQPLTGALGEFKDRQGANNCRVMFWFTDGVFETNPRGVDAARVQLCSPGGVVDQLRRSRIVVIGLQLGNESKDLKPMSLGRSGAATCGTQPIPEGWAPGIYLQAQDSAGLKRIFGRLNDIVQGCTPAGSAGLIDPGIHHMRITINTPSLSQTVRFDTPSGENFVAGTDGQTAARGGYLVRSIRDDQYVSMDVVLPMNAQPGTWRVTPDVPVQAGDISFCVFSDLRLQKSTALPTQDGASALVSVQVVDRDGKQASLADYATVTPAVAVRAQGGAPRPVTATVDPQGRVDIAITPEPNDARVDISLRVHLVTNSGLALTPLSLDFGQQLVLPSGYPIVEPRDVLDLGKTVKTKAAATDLRLMGSPDGPTQVCLDAPVAVTVPDDAAGTTLTYPTGCLELAQGESKVVRVVASPAHAAVGDGAGTIPIRLVSAPDAQGTTESATFDLPVTWRFTDPTNFLITTVIAVLVGLLSALIPLAAISLAGWWAARYQVRDLQGTAFDVVVTGDTVRRAQPLENLPGRLVDSLDLSLIPGGGSAPRRSFDFDGIRFRSRAPLSPARAPRFWAEAPEGRALLASTWQPGDPDDGSRVSVTPGLGFLTILSCSVADLKDDSRREIPGRVVILTKDREWDGARLDARVIGSLDLSEFRRRVKDLADAAGGPQSDSSMVDPSVMSNLWD